MKKRFPCVIILICLTVSLFGCSPEKEAQNTEIDGRKSELLLTEEQKESLESTTPETSPQKQEKTPSAETTLPKESVLQVEEDGVYMFPDPYLDEGESDVIVRNYHVVPDKTVFKIQAGTWTFASTVKIAFRKDNQDFCEYVNSAGHMYDYTFDTQTLAEGDYDIVVYNTGGLPIFCGSIMNCTIWSEKNKNIRGDYVCADLQLI